MPRSEATSALSKHLWNHHGRKRAEGTRIQRLLLHEELHATAAPGELNHSHGPEGEFVTACACGHEHTCTVLAETYNISGD